MEAFRWVEQKDVLTPEAHALSALARNVRVASGNLEHVNTATDTTIKEAQLTLALTTLSSIVVRDPVSLPAAVQDSPIYHDLTKFVSIAPDNEGHVRVTDMRKQIDDRVKLMTTNNEWGTFGTRIADYVAAANALADLLDTESRKLVRRESVQEAVARERNERIARDVISQEVPSSNTEVPSPARRSGNQGANNGGGASSANGLQPNAPGPVSALADGQPTSSDDPGINALIKDKQRDAGETAKNFHGINLGVGPSVSFDLGGKHRIDSAKVVDGRVRVDKESEAQLRLLLETHYFFTPPAYFLWVPPERWGIGPFLALQSSTEDVLDAYAIGMMIGFRYKEDLKGSFNIGIGALIDPNTKVLGDNVVANKPLPDGETEVRTKEETRIGLTVTVSFSF